MFNKKIGVALGLMVMVVVIGGFAWFFVGNKEDAPVEEQVAEDFVEQPLVVDQEVNKWTEVLSSEGVQLRVVNMTSLRAEPFITAEELDAEVNVDDIFDEIACCFAESETGSLSPMGWSKVSVNGVEGFIDLLDAEYVVVDEALAEEESEGGSIAEVIEETEEGSDTEGVAETPVEPVEESPVVAETPVTPQEPMTETLPSGSEVTTIPQSQAQEQAASSVDDILAALGATDGSTVPNSSANQTGAGAGQNFGDLQ